MGAKEKIVILGGTRGLGKAYLREAQNALAAESEFLVIARTEKDLSELRQEFLGVETLALDVTSQKEEICLQVLKFEPDRILYSVGGGPYGPFAQHQWNSHQWAFEVNFLFPAYLLHTFLSSSMQNLPQMTFVGSAIAESQADPKAASYGAAKQALFGLLRSVVQEGGRADLRLFSPGYMNTKLLPIAEKLKAQGHRVFKPEEVARDLWRWQQAPTKNFHRIFND